MKASESPELNLQNRNLSLFYSSEPFIPLAPFSPEAADNVHQLCRFHIPFNFEEGHKAYCLSNGFKPVSYFNFYEAPTKLFLQGLPEGWKCLKRYANGMCQVSWKTLTNPSFCFEAGQKWNLNLTSMWDIHDQNSCNMISAMVKSETREQGFARLRPQIIEMIDAAMTHEEIAYKLHLPEDLIDEILKSQPGNQ
jgi:hypothetical protein